LHEYKKYLKLDPECEEFNVRVQNLLSTIHECKKFVGEKAEVAQEIIYNEYLTQYLSEMCENLRANIDLVKKVYIWIDESSELVRKLIYTKKHRIKLIENNISNQKKAIAVKLIFPFFAEENVQINKLIIKKILSKIEQIKAEIKSVKNEVKSLTYDSKCQYFIKIRFSQSIHIM